MNKDSINDRRLFIGLLALLVWLPLPFASNRVWAESVFEIWAMILALLWLWGWGRGQFTASQTFVNTRLCIILLSVWLLYLCFLLIPLPLSLRNILSPTSVVMFHNAGVDEWASLSVDPYSGFLYLLKSVGYVLLFSLILLLVNTKKRLVILAYSLLLSGFFQAFYGSMMTLSGAEYGFFVKKIDYTLGVATGTFINRNHFAGYLEMTLSIGIGLLMATHVSNDTVKTWRHQVRNFIKLILSPKLVIRMVLAMMVIALVLTHSRMGNTAFFSSMLVSGVFCLIALRAQSSSVRDMFLRKETRATVILLSSLILIDIFIVGAWFGVEKVVERIEQTSVVNDIGRIEVVQNTLKLWKDYSIVGSGGGSFHTVYPRYRPESIDAYYDHTHQDYLEIAADTGLIGLTLLALIVILSIGVALVALFKRHDSLMRGMAFSSLMGTIALLIHGTVDFNLQIPANAATFMVVLALAWIALNMDRHRKRTKGLRNSAENNTSEPSSII